MFKEHNGNPQEFENKMKKNQVYDKIHVSGEEHDMKAPVKYENGLGKMEIREVPVPEPNTMILIGWEMLAHVNRLKIYDDKSHHILLLLDTNSLEVVKLGKGKVCKN